MTGASAAATCPSRTRDAAVVGNTCDVDEVLDGDRHAVQRSAIAAGGQLAIRGFRVSARFSAITRMNALSDGWSSSMRRRQAFGDFERRHFAAREAVRANSSMVIVGKKKARTEEPARPL